MSMWYEGHSYFLLSYQWYDFESYRFGCEEHTIAEYVHEMYEMRTINSDYIIIRVAAAIFLFANGLTERFFELFSTQDATKEAEQV